jgi:hypothetical protein
MTKTAKAFLTLVLVACAFVAVPNAREAYYENKCSNDGGVALWLANGPSDQKPDGWGNPYCSLDGTVIPM